MNKRSTIEEKLYMFFPGTLRKILNMQLLLVYILKALWKYKVFLMAALFSV